MSAKMVTSPIEELLHFAVLHYKAVALDYLIQLSHVEAARKYSNYEGKDYLKSYEKLA